MNQKEIINKIHEFYNRIEDYMIYYSLREWGLRHIRESTIQTVKYCIVMGYMSQPITVSYIHYLVDKTSVSRSAISNRLHILGDKNVINLLGFKGSVKIYELNTDFASILKIGLIEEILEWREKHIGKLHK
jgi:hypothetical protein